MRSFLRIVSTLACIAALGSCSSATAPTEPVSVTLHGMLVVPAEDATGVQGRTDAWFVDDRSLAYDLLLTPDLQFLNDPDLNGRTLTITGDLVVPEHVPIGGNPRVFEVVEVRLDEP
jgi:hypothetical protein